MSRNGSTIGTGYSYIDQINRIRNLSRIFSREDHQEGNILYHLRCLKEKLDITLPNDTLVQEFKKQTRHLPTMRVNRVNMASVMFYIILKRFKINFNLDHLLQHSNLTRQSFWRIYSKLIAHNPALLKTVQNDKTQTYYTNAELARIQQEFHLPLSVVEEARAFLANNHVSPLGRVNAAVAVFLAHRKLKASGELRPGEIYFNHVWKFLKVAPSTVYLNVEKFLKGQRVPARAPAKANQVVSPIKTEVRPEVPVMASPAKPLVAVALTASRLGVPLHPAMLEIIRAVQKPSGSARKAFKGFSHQVKIPSMTARSHHALPITYHRSFSNALIAPPAVGYVARWKAEGMAPHHTHSWEIGCSPPHQRALGDPSHRSPYLSQVNFAIPVSPPT